MIICYPGIKAKEIEAAIQRDASKSNAVVDLLEDSDGNEGNEENEEKPGTEAEVPAKPK